MYTLTLLAHMTCTPEPTSESARSKMAYSTRLVGMCRNLPFGGRATRGSRVRLPWEGNARSCHQRLFEENVEKTGKSVVYKL